MKYIGSKNKYSSQILSILTSKAESCKISTLIETCAGGFNLTQNIDLQVFNRVLCNDKNEYLIEFVRSLIAGEFKPVFVSRERYLDIRKNKRSYPKAMVGFVGVCCSYNGKWFGGYTPLTTTKEGNVRDYIGESIRGLSKQVPKLQALNIHLLSRDMLDVQLEDNSIVYIDPPYRGTLGYGKYNTSHENIELFCQIGSLLWDNIHFFVSEYSAISDSFSCVWELDTKSTVSNKLKHNTEKLFYFENQ